MAALAVELELEWLYKRLDTEKVPTSMKKLGVKLHGLLSALVNAKMRQQQRPEIYFKKVSDLVKKVRDFAHDVEDVVDEIAHETLQSDRTSLVEKGFNLIMWSKIWRIRRQLHALIDQSKGLGLKIESDVTEEWTTGIEASPRLPAEAVVIGRHQDKEAVIELLLGDQNKPFSVIPIYGTVGVGKTTLARIVYHDHIVEHHFDLRVWVRASEENLDALGLTRKVLQSIIPNRWDGMDLNGFQTKLQQILCGKRFLIVLDGLSDSHSRYAYSDPFYNSFRNGVSGSKLLVTTTHYPPSYIGGSYRLPILSDDDCLSLFAHHALGGRNGFYAHPRLQSRGKEFVKRCLGVPLVAVLLGGLLHNNQDPNVWDAILHAMPWSENVSFGEITGFMLGIIRFLPSHLVYCLAYCCSLFPRGHLFHRDELIQLWMSEGCLPLKEGRLHGSIYFDNLLSRSLFQPSHTHEKLFEMNLYLPILSCCNVHGHFQDPYAPSRRRIHKIRHISFKADIPNVFNQIRRNYQLDCLQTLLAINSPDTKRQRTSLSNDALHKLLRKVTCLRVLSLNYFKIRELPVPVRLMKHLRHLNMSGTEIKCLPEWVGDLVSLRALLLAECHNLVSLPQCIGNLVNLQFLDIFDTPKLQEMPVGIGRLESLQKLSKFMVGKHKGLGIKEIGNLPWLQGDLLISGLHNVVDAEDAKKANLKDKDGLDSLGMEWSSTFDGSRNGMIDMEVMDSLHPHANLKKLGITYYGGTAFSLWIGHPSFTNMLSAELRDCRAVRSLPSLGRLPLLRDLSIVGLHSVTTVGSEFYGDGDSIHFPCLETLLFEDMPEWVEWLPPTAGAGNGSFPSLRELEIVNCPKFVGELPEGMMDKSKNKGVCPLERLELRGCPSLAKFPTGGISTPTLKQFIIRDCSQLECISKRMLHFSTSLAAIDFKCYAKLTSLPGYLPNLKFLVQMSLSDCPSLEYFPDFPQDGVPFPKLQELTIKNCDSLKSLPSHMNKLTSLRSLSISNCPRLNSLPEGGFLPPNLTSLFVLKCTNVHVPISDWGLENLSSLLVLAIEAVGPPDMATFPDYFCILPPSITNLSVKQMQNLEYLGDGLLDLTSLKELVIVNCPVLKYFPRDGLPPTIRALSIHDCPLLQQRCARDEGEYWPFLAYIPVVQTDQKPIRNPEFGSPHTSGLRD